MAMERLEGEPLAARLSRGAMPIAETVQIGLEVLAALDALHRRGITHRDLKPSNVFLTPHGAKVLDFGVSLGQTGDATRLPLTSPGAMLGTPKYMAPEQALGNCRDRQCRPVRDGGDSVRNALRHRRIRSRERSRDIGESAARRRAHARADRRRSRRSIASFTARSQNRLRSDMPVRPRWPRICGRRSSRSGSEGHRGARPVTRLMVLPFRLLRPDAEIDFLAFSLADAVMNSLSPLESLVVRSTLAAARFASNMPDLKRSQARPTWTSC